MTPSQLPLPIAPPSPFRYGWCEVHGDVEPEERVAVYAVDGWARFEYHAGCGAVLVPF